MQKLQERLLNLGAKMAASATAIRDSVISVMVGGKAGVGGGGGSLTSRK